jgi:hypothetical protein
MRQKRIAYRLLVGKPWGKRPLGKLRRRWTDNIKIELGEMEWGDVGCILRALERDRLESSCVCGNEDFSTMKCWETIEWLYNWWHLEYCRAPYS